MLHESKYIIVIDKNDLKKICDREKNLFSLIYDKYVALKEEIDYETYIVKHEAEDCMIWEGWNKPSLWFKYRFGQRWTCWISDSDDVLWPWEEKLECKHSILWFYDKKAGY